MGNTLLTTPSPKRWVSISNFPNGTIYYSPGERLRVTRTVEDLGDGRTWLHAAVSHKNRTPTHAELQMVKDEFFGQVETYLIFPAVRQHVVPNGIHLWSCLDAPLIPDNSLRMLAMNAQDRLSTKNV